MGYSITIGQRVPPIPGEEYGYPSVSPAREATAPAFGEPTDYTNERWPSYSGWAEFLEATGLQWLSPRTSREFAQHARPDCPPLMVNHPGAEPILPIHREVIEAAYTAYVAKIGTDKIPGWPPEPDNDETPDATVSAPAIDPSLYNPQLARLEWLRFWVNWALDNCSDPAFGNT